jgi:hypothetical protein
VSSPVYNHRGHLNDHVKGHMPQGFVSVWCAVCNAPFRNRQSLHRHQKKSGCTRNNKTVIEPRRISTSRESINIEFPGTILEREKGTSELIESKFDESILTPCSLFYPVS